MINVKKLLNTIRDEYDLGSDAQLSEFLKTNTYAIWGFRNGRMIPRGDITVRMAKALGYDPAYLLIEMQVLQTKKIGHRKASKIWKDLAKKIEKFA